VSRVLVAEKISEAGLDILRRDGHDVIDGVGWPRPRLLAELANADALVVRSATRVDAELLAAAPVLKVVGRAGVGVDNIDVEQATRRGVLVINSPTGNVVSAVEHTFAILLALLRRIPAAAASLREGRWERGRFTGTELEGKAMGIVGLGQVGSRVATRAAAFGARVLAFDPYVPSERAEELGARLVELDELLSTSDIVTLHATATESSKKMIGREALARMKKSAVLVNVARGNLVDHEALEEALAAGRIGGAALDVFDPEPPRADDPIFRMDNVVATPHLGASTREAQERVAIQTLEAVRDALGGAAYVPAVNLPFRRLADAGGAARWMDLAERLGRFLAQTAGAPARAVSLDAWGLPAEFLRPAALAAVKGVLSEASPETVNLVNALGVARERGIAVSETAHEAPGPYASSVRITAAVGGAERSVEGTIFGRDDPRVVAVDGRSLEFRPRGVALQIVNRDVPGVVGIVGTILGRSGVNIADLTLSRGDAGSDADAMAILSVDTRPSAETIAELAAHDAVRRVRVLEW
jgi:D-3-phosphoglycerate dehydrogenase